MDPSSLEQAAAAVAARLGAGADVMILNKFGVHEASGWGFLPGAGPGDGAGHPGARGGE
ncbi:DUF2478 domain-containing protein [Vannielia sp. SX4]|uniref:DUF2478 domain-containing protein n=1 Tax=Vannielia sp. SX4 TaxID=3463852 RepID=UPI004059F4E1